MGHVGSDLVNAAPSSMYPVIIIVLAAMVVGAISLASFLLKDLKNSFEKAQTRQDCRIDAVDAKIAELHARLPIDYVRRDDYVRSMAGLELKMDRMYRDVTRLAKGLAKFMSDPEDQDGGE